MNKKKHEIKNDLAVIYAYTQILLKKYNDKNNEIAKTIEKRIRSIEKKVDSM